MKNFPHQFNELEKLRGALETTRDLTHRGSDPGDDGILGYELAARRIYRFRGLDYEDAGLPRRITQRVNEEQTKPSGNQGARTAARELRRTLVYLGWISDSLELTPLGEELLETPLGSPEEQALLAASLMQLDVADAEGNRSHPVRVLLRLVREVDFYSREGMEMSLEAVDDSEPEFLRVRQVAELQQAQLEAARELLGITPSQAKNAVKILPTLAKTGGLITVDGAERYVLTPLGEALLTAGHAEVRDLNHRTRRARPVQVTSTEAVRMTADRVGRRRLGRRRALSIEEQLEATQLLVERTDRHQNLVRTVASHAGPAAIYEDSLSFDLLIDPEDTSRTDA